ncbi:MAG TPA: S8 family serine peptidase [Solirubrobacterales bacterium]|nr:S8 family serine peptidase [Solirubrobacterales bacterium]
MNCVSVGSPGAGCVNGGEDLFGHGTHVAGIIGARDNSFGVAGTAPGVRIWSVRVLNYQGNLQTVDGALYKGQLSDVIAAVNWVTERSSAIEVVNMSFGCEEPDECNGKPLREAIAASVDKGVVYVASAGNDDRNVTGGKTSYKDVVTGIVSYENLGPYVPAAYDDPITVSALTDFDGLPGSSGAAGTCSKYADDQDDSLGNYSNWGPKVDIAAPGTCILSTSRTGGYEVKTGTSMAAPMVAGAVAGMAAANNPNSRADVEAIRNFVRALGNYNWIDTHSEYAADGSEVKVSDGIQEPLLDMGAKPASSLTATTGGSSYVYSTSATLLGTVNPGGPAGASYHFDYGTSAAYTHSTPTVSAGSGTAPIPVSAGLSGLESAKTYHYRIVANNVEGKTVIGSDRIVTTVPQVGMVAGGSAYAQSFPYTSSGWSIIDSNGDTQMRLSGPTATVIRGNYSYYQNKPFSCCGWQALDTFDTRLEITSQTGGQSLLAAIRTDGNAYTQSTPLTCCGWSIVDNSDRQVSMTSPTTGGSYVGAVRKNGNAYIQHTPLTCCGWQIVDNNVVQMAMASNDAGGTAMAVLRNTNGNGTGNTYIQNAPFNCCGWSIVDNNDRQVAMARGTDGKIRLGVVRTDGSAWVQSAPFSCCAWTKVADASMNVQRLVMSGDTIAILRGNPASGIVSYQQAPFATTKWQDIGSGATQVVLQGGSPTDTGDASSPAPPDKDADLVPDTDDGCPTVAGSYAKAGC